MADLEHRVATLDEFRAIAESVGWLEHFHWPVVEASLAASLYGVVAVHEGRVVGTARVVGDGHQYFYVQDVMVDPERDGEGIGTTMTQALIDWVRQTAPPRAFLGLFASPSAVGVYDELGFSTADMIGMHLPLD